MTHIVTKEFLEEAISEKIESFEVNSGSNVGDGYTSVLYTIDVVLKNSLEKRHLLLKSYPTHPVRQEMLSKMNLFEKELRIYDTLIPELTSFQKEWVPSGQEISLPFPQFYFGRAVDYTKMDSMLCDDPLKNCIMMEDLRKTRGFHLADRFKGFDFAHAQLVIVAQAKFHAVSWVYKSKLNLSTLCTLIPSMARGWVDEVDSGWFDAMFSHSTFEDAIQKEVKDENEKTILLESLAKAKSIASDIFHLYMGVGDKPGMVTAPFNKDNCLRIPGQVKEDEEWWGVALHVDSRLDNMMFRYDDQGNPLEVVLLDLQTIKEGDPTSDICNSMFTSTNPAPWIQHSDQLLSIYEEKFLDICTRFAVAPPKGFNLTELKRRFHRGQAYGFALTLMCFPILLSDPQNAVDLEKVDKDIKGDEVFEHIASMSKGVTENTKFNKLVVEVMRKLYERGII